jgi:hypothetical protein
VHHLLWKCVGTSTEFEQTASEYARRIVRRPESGKLFSSLHRESGHKQYNGSARAPSTRAQESSRAQIHATAAI